MYQSGRVGSVSQPDKLTTLINNLTLSWSVLSVTVYVVARRAGVGKITSGVIGGSVGLVIAATLQRKTPLFLAVDSR